MTEAEFLLNIKENKGIINKLVSLYASDYEERKDFSQEIILQAWKSVNNFKGESKFSTWLYRLALNTLLVLNRKEQKVYYNDDLTQFEANLTIPSKPTSENSEKLLFAIKQLSTIDRAIIVMSLDGYTNAEIAAYFGISVNNATVKIHRIKEDLTRKLKK